MRVNHCRKFSRSKKLCSSAASGRPSLSESSETECVSRAGIVEEDVDEGVDAETVSFRRFLPTTKKEIRRSSANDSTNAKVICRRFRNASMGELSILQ